MIKRNYGMLLLCVMAILIGFTSCEQEDRFVGANVVGDGSAQFHTTYVDVEATTLLPDTIRSDRSVLQNATFGVFDEPLLGKTKSYYYSQVRLGTLDPDFGDNPIVDSVVLSIPVFTVSSDTLQIEHYLEDTSYALSNPSDGDCSISDTLDYYKNRFKFKVDSIYGNASSNMTLQVHRVVENLKTIDSAKYSNDSPQVGELLGSMQISDEVWKEVGVRRNSTDAESDSTIISESNASYRLKLEGMRDFVQQNIVNQEGSSNLGDQISFINNVLQGIRIGVADENGFIVNFDQTQLTLRAYISSDNDSFVDTNGNGIHDDEEDCPVTIIEPRTTSSLSFVIGANLSLTDGGYQYYNVAQNEIINEAGSVAHNQEDESVNYVEGMAGSKIKISLDAEQLEAIKDSIQQKNWVITEAHFKLYPDTNMQGNLPLPDMLYAYNYSQNSLLPDYGDPDDAEVQAFPYLQISRPYDENGYYLLRVTEFVKNILEKNEPVDDLAIEMGTYLGFSSSYYFYSPANAFYSNRVFNPYRLAVVGTNPTAGQADKKLQLEVYYNKKEN